MEHHPQTLDATNVKLSVAVSYRVIRIVIRPLTKMRVVNETKMHRQTTSQSWKTARAPRSISNHHGSKYKQPTS